MSHDTHKVRMNSSRRTGFGGAAVLVTALVGGLVVASLAAAVLSMHVILLRGKTSQGLAARFSYNVKRHTLNGFSVSYTCHGKKPHTDSDVYTIVDGGDDSIALATVKNGSVHFNLRGQTSRFSEDGPISTGSGRLVVNATVTSDRTKWIMKGTAHVRNAKCPSAELAVRSAGGAS